MLHMTTFLPHDPKSPTSKCGAGKPTHGTPSVTVYFTRLSLWWSIEPSSVATPSVSSEANATAEKGVWKDEGRRGGIVSERPLVSHGGRLHVSTLKGIEDGE